MLAASLLLLASLSSGVWAAAQEPEAKPWVHSICDISQSFTFYMDGRFHRQYLQGHGRDARNWGSLSQLDLSHTNLLVLTGGDRHLPYAKESVDHVVDYVQQGGALLIMADGGKEAPAVTPVVERFEAKLKAKRAEKPLAGIGNLKGWKVEFRGGGLLHLSPAWLPLLLDARKKPVLAKRSWGKGQVLLGSRGLFGQRPDASDPINARWITPLLLQAAGSQVVDRHQPHRSTWAELEKQIGPLTLEFHQGTAPFADRIAKEYLLIRPHLVAVTGVEPAPGMIKRLLILPTGGGGFSSGQRIAIGAWWGDYPNRRYPMVELIGHEAGHSWVLPYPEPLWNEPIATYLGIQVGKRLGMPEAQQTLERQLAAGRRHDPDFTKLDPLAEDAPRDLIWGKSYFVFEELEKRHGPGALAKYFRTKRQVLKPGRSGFSMDDCVAVWSQATGEDLFPWFQSLAFSVDAGKTDLSFESGSKETGD
ncbi:MAG: hypothetical protein DWQ01_19485 [Planctomycetota bacterium]|nr:MAG: hypothetical protein DWQ01_19485 [Planctomycetota bacterium]